MGFFCTAGAGAVGTVAAASSAARPISLSKLAKQLSPVILLARSSSACSQLQAADLLSRPQGLRRMPSCFYSQLATGAGSKRRVTALTEKDEWISANRAFL